MYIHELPNWPDFRWDEASLSQLVARVRLEQGRLLGRMEFLGFNLRQEANLRALTADAIETSDIEGVVLDEGQVRSSLARRLGIEIAGLTKSDRQVDGLVEMLLDATQNFKQPLTDKRLYKWQSKLFPAGRNSTFRVVTGRWRDDCNGPMQVVSGAVGRERVHFEAPPARRLKAEIRRFLTWFNAASSCDEIIKTGIAHLWFVTIHPFDEGNGRIARAIADLALSRAEGIPERFYSMSSQIRAERKAYYQVLERTQKGSLDVTDWLKWYLSCLERAILGAQSTQSVIIRKARIWERLRGVPLNERQQKVLNKFLDSFEGKMTTSKWAKLGKCSQDTAHRDITELIERAILQKDEAGGRSTSYSINVVP